MLLRRPLLGQAPATHTRCGQAARCCELLRVVHLPAAPTQRKRRCVGCRSERSESDGNSVVPDALPLADSTTDWRDFRARLVASSRTSSAPAASGGGVAKSELDPPPSSAASIDLPRGLAAGWVHPITRPERGCLLVAHPSMFRSSQTYFFRSLILLLDHDEDKGSYGVILNRPTQYTIQMLTAADLLNPEFADNTLYLGGDVGDGSVHVLHKHGELDGVERVVNGVYSGGARAAKEAVASGKADAADFRWYARYAGWSAGQLEREVAAGVWFPAAASAEVVLARDEASDTTWHAVMQAMGGDYAVLSRKIMALEKNALEKSE